MIMVFQVKPVIMVFWGDYGVPGDCSDHGDCGVQDDCGVSSDCSDRGIPVIMVFQVNQ